MATSHVGARFSSYFHILFTSRTLQNSKVEESLWGKKSRPQEERKGIILSRKENIPLWKLLVLAELHACVQISTKEVAVKPKFAIHDGHYCVVLLNAPLSDRGKKKCLQWVTFHGKYSSIVNDAGRSRCFIGLRFQEALSTQPIRISKKPDTFLFIDALWIRLWSHFARAAYIYLHILYLCSKFTV